MSKYLELIKVSTPYATKMERLSNRIFGNVVRKTESTSMKTVKMYSEKPTYMKDHIVNYYPRHRETFALICALRSYGLFRDEHADFRDEMNRLRSLRGKVNPRTLKRQEKS